MVVENECGQHARDKEVFHAKGIERRLIRCPKRDFHKVENIGRASDEEELHESVVEGDIVREKVQISSYEYDLPGFN